MRILVICNNYGAYYDGIGAYSKKIYSKLAECVNIKICTAYCEPNQKLKRILGLGMTWEMTKACYYLFFHKVDKVIVEYPFVEWNPLVCFVATLLKLITILLKKEIVVTLHEFKRVNKLRKLVIWYLATIADVILVTEKENLELLTKINSMCFKINVPSNIEANYDENLVKAKKYVYFGIVNNAKAFDEMLDGWDEFNIQSKYELCIITSTKLENIDKHKNVKYIYNASEKLICETMSKVAYSIVPIKPFVDEKNATFKTSCLAGCISIGCFCNEFEKLPFVIEMEAYSKKGFIVAFEKSMGFDSQKIKKLSKESAAFGEQYTAENTAKQYIEFLSLL